MTRTLFFRKAKFSFFILFMALVTSFTGVAETVNKTNEENPPPINCSALIMPGTVTGNQSICGTSLDPTVISNVTLGSSTEGPVQYLWMYRNASTAYVWTTTGVTTDSIDPGVITETTEYTRCAGLVGCSTYPSETNIITISIFPPLGSSVISSDITCNGAMDGTASIAVSGGGGPGSYYYQWTNGASTASISGLSAGTYSVTVTDTNSCTTSGTVTIAEPAVLSEVTTSTDVTCYDAADGTAAIAVSGGTMPYNYLWSDGQTTASLTGLDAGSYSVTVTDASGCTIGQSVTITQPNALIASSTSTGLTCNTSMDATIDATVTGGVAPYTYSWDNGETTEDLAGLSDGTYTLTVTDASGCSTTEVVTIAASPINCCNLVTPGTIGFNQANCGPFTPNTIISLSPGQNLSGAPVDSVEHVWMYRDGTTNGNWIIYGGGVTSDTLAPGLLTMTTEFIRCVRNVGCTTYPGETNIVTITIHPVPTVTVSGVDVTCNGDDDGTATASVTGGTSGSMPMSLFTTLASNNGQSGNMFDIDATTDVTINSFDIHLNSMSAEDIEIYWKSGTYLGSENTAADWTLVGSVNVVGQGQGNLTSVPLTVNVPIAAGSSASFYVTSTVANVDLFSYTNGTAAGSVYVSDPNIEILEGIGISYPFGGTYSPRIWNGQVHYTAGIASGYDYAWSNGDTTATTSGLAPGTYTVTITDANGCTATDSVTITEPAVLAISSATTTDVTCYDANDGTASVTVTGGTAPYSYSWSNGDTTATISGLAPGSYTGTVTDANGCTVEGTVTITEPAVLAISSATTTDVTCNGANDGTASVTVTGGTAPYTYAWDNGATTASISGLAPGSYTGTITDANGCMTSGTVTIAEPTALAEVTTSTNVLCNGGSDGTATVVISGGTMPYAYDWSNGATTASISGLVAGTYALTVTDANGCVINAVAVITEPTALAEVVNSTNVSCNGGSDGTAMAVITGGTAPYSYAWSNGAITASISGLAAGTYTVTATDANGCMISGSATITEPTALAEVTTSTNVTCYGLTDGTATFTVTGGTAPYTYAWSDGQTTAMASGLAAGSYTVTATDANGCMISGSVSITEPTELLESEGSISTDVSCNGGTDGTATFEVFGGTMPYTYAWSDGQTTAMASALAAGTYTVTVTDANGCTISGSFTISEPTALVDVTTSTNVSCNGGTDGTAMTVISGGTAPYTYAWGNGETTASITGLAAGTYTVTVTDANGCTIMASATVTEPTALNEVTTSTDVSCNGGSDGTAMIVITGGTNPYQIVWGNSWPANTIGTTASNLPAGTYTATVTDANGCTIVGTTTISEPTPLAEVTTSTNVSCNGGTDGTAMFAVSGGTAPYTYAWSDGQTTAMASGLAAGTYTVTATDANGCTISGSATVTEPTALAEVTTSTNVSCNGGTDGTAMTVISGGTAPYTYAWDNGATTASISGLAAGTYTVTVTDANGCVISQSVTITEPNVLLGNKSGTNVSCNGLSDGTASIAVLGGTAPYTYSWNDPANQTTATATGLAAGTYTVTVTDANGCMISKTVIITEPAALAQVTTSTNVSCYAGTDGTAMIIVAGGTAPYTYAWDNGATTASISGLAAGTYTVLVTDANGCEISGSATVTEPTALAEVTTSTNVSCNGGTDGTAMVVISGGTAPYTYAWSNGETTSSISGLAAGTYTVTATDANGCTISGTATVTEPTALAQMMTSSNVSCNAGADGTATFTVSGGTAPYTYAWSNGETTASVAGLTAGTYTVTAIDANGCEIYGTATITEPTALAEVTTSTNVSCYGGTDGTAMVVVSGGTAPYTYAWDNGATTASISGLAAGTYTVVVTDANGCTISQSATVTQPTMLVSVTSTVDVTCHSYADGSATITVSGGTAPYTYAWSDGQTTATAVDLDAGIYTVTATDANGCTTTETVTIVEPIEFHSVATSIDASCYGSCDGTATAVETGGVLPYTYLWSDGQTAATSTGLCAGAYTMTATDANGCMASASVVIGEPSEIAVTFSTSSSTSTILATATNGAVPYTYLWSTGSTSSLLTGAVDGTTYTVTVTDANGCTTVETIVYDDAVNQFVINVGPNPFSVYTTMKISTPVSADIAVDIYDAQGNIVENTYNGYLESGVVLELQLDGQNIEPGLYFCRVVSSEGMSSSKKLFLVK